MRYRRPHCRNSLITTKVKPTGKGVDVILDHGVRASKKFSEVALDFSAKNLTGFGGLSFFGEFIKRLDLETLLDQVKVPHFGKFYSTGRLLLMMLFGFVLGGERMQDVAALRLDRTLLRVLGWRRWPVQSTITRFLHRFEETAVASLLDVMVLATERFRIGWRDFERLHLDLDSHVRTVHGKTLENAVVGYNPNKRGRPSYHPLMAFIGETRDILRGVFRPGNTTTNGVVQFLKDCLQQLNPSATARRIKWIIVRADSGFCYTEFLQTLEAQGVGLKYVVALKCYRRHQSRFGGLTYERLEDSDSIETATYQSTDWPDGKVRRIVVVREAVPEDKKQDVAGKQLKLFPELKGYAYRAFVTNSLAPSVEIWRDYNGRATCENVIKEGIFFGLDINATRKFYPNAAHFLLTLFAYNLMNWFKEVAIGETHAKFGQEIKRMPKWIRSRLLCVPAKLVASARQLTLKFSREWPWRSLIEKAIARIAVWAPSS